MNQLQIQVMAKPTTRYIAVVIDGLMIGLLILPVFLYSYIHQLVENEQYILIVYFFLYKLFVYVLFDVIIPFLNNGKTIGRSIMHIKLSTIDGHKVTLFQYLRRASIFILIGIIGDIFLLGVVAYLLWTLVFIVSIIFLYTEEYRRTVHDFVAGTCVVNDIMILEENEE